MDDNTRIFLEFFQNFQWPEPRPLIFRLYHDADGLPLFYSSEDLPGTWIEISQRDYELRDEKVRVVNGKLHHLPSATAKKLRVDSFGTPCHPEDITIVVTDSEPNLRWSFIPHAAN